MKRVIKYTLRILPLLLAAALVHSCTKSPLAGETAPEGGALLQLSVGFKGMTATRLAELPDGNAVNDATIGGTDYELNHIGLYVYYTADYRADDLSMPYVRNLECEVVNGMLVPVDAGRVPDDGNIFIYDEMTVVAFYPYNPDMSLPENYFNVREDEENYPITRQDYSEQYYIPYRAQANTNPTTAFLTQLWFYPKHTFKLEITLVGQSAGDFPDPGDVQLLPAADPVGNPDYPNDGMREVWVDEIIPYTNDGSGSDVRQYIAYIWTRDEDTNDIQMGDILLDSPTLTLIASQNVTVQEEYIYRYGHNINMGEIFIPTSSAIVYDGSSLAALDGSNPTVYQVCDIDLSVYGPWDPIQLISGRYDGGGHKISNMNVTSSDEKAGLFSTIQGNTTVANIDLIDPTVTVTSTADTCYVGALAGQVNNILTKADKAKLIGTIPGDLPQVVKDALLADLLADLVNTTCNVVACRIENPTITVTGTVPIVGSLCGMAGDKDLTDNYYSVIRDCYVLGGTLSVNAGDPAANAGGYVGGFVGLNQGTILRCYTTTDQITAQHQVTDPGTGTTTPEDMYQGFGTQGDFFTPAQGGSITSSFAMLPDNNAGVGQLPGDWPPASWVTYSGVWPTYYIGWLEGTGNSFWYSTGTAGTTDYPILQWQRR